MAAASSMMMRMKKRKEADDVGDDFSHFSLSSPAPKIRRLDVDVLSPPAPTVVVEEEEDEYKYKPPAVGAPRLQSGVVIEELPSSDGNVLVNDDDEKAIVPFKPLGYHIAASPSSFFSVNSEFIAGIKSRLLRSDRDDHWISAEEVEEEKRNESKEHLAIVPWVPSQQVPVARDLHEQQVPELMETDEMGEATMDIEDDGNSNVEMNNSYQYEAMPGTHTNVFPQWQQQHCMVPQLPQNTSTPITWFR